MTPKQQNNNIIRLSHKLGFRVGNAFFYNFLDSQLFLITNVYLNSYLNKVIIDVIDKSGQPQNEFILSFNELSDIAVLLTFAG